MTVNILYAHRNDNWKTDFEPDAIVGQFGDGYDDLEASKAIRSSAQHSLANDEECITPAFTKKKLNTLFTIVQNWLEPSGRQVIFPYGPRDKS